MKNFPIGVISDCFQLGLRGGLERAAQLGAQGVQIYAVDGEMAPENLSPAARKELSGYIHGLGLEVSALCGDMGGHAFTRADDNPRRVERSKRIMDLALELGSKVVTTHIGVVPADPSHPRWDIMAKACDDMGAYADSVGAYFAVETGPEPSARLRQFLDSLPSNGVRVNLDPANLWMVSHDDPVQAVHNLAPYIVHTHAKDGDFYKAIDAEMVYDMFADGGIGNIQITDYFLEKALGQGQVSWKPYLAALEQIGYTGYLTIEREVGPDPAADIAEAIRFLRSIS